MAIPLDGSDGVVAEGIGVQTWAGPRREFAGGTVFGCPDQTTRVTMDGDTFELRPGTWFVAPGGVTVEGGRGLAILVPGYRGLRQFGGPIEARGRLRYIDGCTDTLLASPPRLGDPCLNHLHIPAGTLQSSHVHPGIRIGVIARGQGECVTDLGRFALSPGLGWVIPTGLRHAFHTRQESLDVIAWHPDSDVGPTDENHPMINRTLL